jgi:phage-related protein
MPPSSFEEVMATPTFSWVVNTQASSEIGYTVRSAQMGDGYVAEAGEGVNNKTEAWEVTWTGSDIDLNLIMDFFDERAGYKSFYWITPLGKIGLWKCKNPKQTELGGNTFSFSGTFTKAYAA